jgi:hypothetical protein
MLPVTMPCNASSFTSFQRLYNNAQLCDCNDPRYADSNACL